MRIVTYIKPRYILSVASATEFLDIPINRHSTAVGNVFIHTCPRRTYGYGLFFGTAHYFYRRIIGIGKKIKTDFFARYDSQSNVSVHIDTTTAATLLCPRETRNQGAIL